MAEPNPLPPRAVIDAALSYDPQTGVVRWKVNKRGRAARVGALAGSWREDGYLGITLDGQSYMAHRLIWKLMTGEDPSELLDHEDTDRSNNRWVNLREADHAENTHNSSLHKRSTTGVKGVTLYKRTGRYQAQVQNRGRLIHLGYFASIRAAEAAINAARAGAHGQFARSA